MEIKINHSSPTPLHAQVEILLREMIDKPVYREGKRLPREEDLARRLGVSRNTVRQAMMKLVHEGLIIRKRSFGSIVASGASQRRELARYMSFSKDMLHQEREWINIEVSVFTAPCNTQTARALKIDEGTEVLTLRRLKGTQDEPVVLFHSYFHPRLGIEHADAAEESLYELMDSKYSIVPTMSSEHIQAIPADAALSETLRIPCGDPVFFRDRLVLDPGDRPIEHNTCYYRSDKYTFSLNISFEQH